MPATNPSPTPTINSAGVRYASTRPEDQTANSPAGPVSMPNVSDLKEAWESYATSRGVDTDGMTKEEIIDAVS